MRLWIRYIKEQKAVLLLWLISVFLFVGVGALYHVENLNKLLYAALLTFVVWGAAGFLMGMRYVNKSRRLEEMYRHFEQSGELVLDDWNLKQEERLEEAGTFEEAQLLFLSCVCEEMYKNNREYEKKSAEYKDYYLMWTHQIKTPISALQLLLEGNETLGRDGFLMREELFKIEQYVEMVLTFQRLDSMASDLVLQEYDLYSLIKQAVKKYSVLFINKGLSLDLQEMQVKILTDEKWFVFCLEQILSNSIKYTREGGISIYVKSDSWESMDEYSAGRNVRNSENMVDTAWSKKLGTGEEIRADANPAETAVESKRNGDTVGSCRIRLYIQDTGIGICPEDLPRIFERGFTGHNGRSSFHGRDEFHERSSFHGGGGFGGRMEKKSTGIGLYLCRQIFNHLGIKVKVESREGEGTRVILIWDQQDSSLQAD